MYNFWSLVGAFHWPNPKGSQKIRNVDAAVYRGQLPEILEGLRRMENKWWEKQNNSAKENNECCSFSTEWRNIGTGGFISPRSAVKSIPNCLSTFWLLMTFPEFFVMRWKFSMRRNFLFSRAERGIGSSKCLNLEVRKRRHRKEKQLPRGFPGGLWKNQA